MCAISSAGRLVAISIDADFIKPEAALYLKPGVVRQEFLYGGTNEALRDFKDVLSQPIDASPEASAIGFRHQT
jgi:hypothetical protein